MMMDLNTLATIQQDRHQELMRRAVQQGLAQVCNENGNQLQATATTGNQGTTPQAGLQEKLFAMFQMRIRAVLPR